MNDEYEIVFAEDLELALKELAEDEELSPEEREGWAEMLAEAQKEA